MTALNDVMPGRIWVENHGASAMWDGDGEVLVSGPPPTTNCDVAEYIKADAHAAVIADRDRLQRENDNLRQIERNVQAVREQEHQRANAAEADRDRLAAEVERLREALTKLRDLMCEAVEDDDGNSGCGQCDHDCTGCIAHAALQEGEA